MATEDSKPPREVDQDEKWVRQAQDGDRGAFDLLVRRHQKALYRLTLRYSGNHADAQDLSQATFVKAYRQIHRFANRSSFRAWLYRIAINLCLSHLRKRREPASQVEPVSSSPIAEGELLGHERGLQLRRAIAQLPPKQRLVVELRAMDELSFSEVATIARCSPGSARVNFHHALKRLRELIKKDKET